MKISIGDVTTYAVKEFVDNQIREKGVEFAIAIAPKYNVICNTLVSGTGICEGDKSDLINVGKIFKLPFYDNAYLWKNWNDWITDLSSRYATNKNLMLVTVSYTHRESEQYFIK